MNTKTSDEKPLEAIALRTHVEDEVKSPICMYFFPEELTGGLATCGLLRSVCNGLKTRCFAYHPHTKESRQTLKEAIELRKNQKGV